MIFANQRSGAIEWLNKLSNAAQKKQTLGCTRKSSEGDAVCNPNARIAWPKFIHILMFAEFASSMWQSIQLQTQILHGVLTKLGWLRIKLLSSEMMKRAEKYRYCVQTSIENIKTKQDVAIK